VKSGEEKKKAENQRVEEKIKKEKVYGPYTPLAFQLCDNKPSLRP